MEILYIVTMFANRNNKWSCKLIAINYSSLAFPCWSNSQPLSLWLFLVYPLSFFNSNRRWDSCLDLDLAANADTPDSDQSLYHLLSSMEIWKLIWLLEHQYIIDWMSERKILMKVSLNIFIAYSMVWLFYNLILSFICFLLFLQE